MVELYKVLADSTKIIVLTDRYRWKYLSDRPLYMGEVYNIPVALIDKRINFLEPCIINNQQFILCEVD